MISTLLPLFVVIGASFIGGIWLAVWLPAPVERWWPVTAPLLGLASWVVLLQNASIFMAPGKAGWVVAPVLLVASLIGIVAKRLARPHAAAMLVAALGFVATLVAYAPSLVARESVPPGIVNNDAMFYLPADDFLRDHRVDDRGPVDDPVLSTWRRMHDIPLRLGIDLFDAAISETTGWPVDRTYPAILAVSVGLATAAVALFGLAVGLPAWAAAAAALGAFVRPDTFRTALDSFFAQTAGSAIAIAAMAVSIEAIRRGGRARVLAAATLIAGTVSIYVEWVPTLAIVLGVVVLVALVRPWFMQTEAGRWSVATRAACLGLIAFIIDIPGATRGLANLLALRDISIPGGFYRIEEYLALTSGPAAAGLTTGALLFDHWSLTQTAMLSAVGGVLGFFFLPRAGKVVAASLAFALMLLVLRLTVLSPFAYGLLKVAWLGQVLVFIGLGALLLRKWARPVGFVTLGALAASGVIGTWIVVDAATPGTGPTTSEIALQDLSPPSGATFLEGSDLPSFGVIAREHWRVWYLTQGRDKDVRWWRTPLSYFGVEPGSPAQTFDDDYGWVVAEEGSPTRRDPPRRCTSGFCLWQRSAEEVFTVGQGWFSVEDSARWTRGQMDLLIDPSEKARGKILNLVLRVSSPDGPRRLFLPDGTYHPIAEGETATVTVGVAVKDDPHLVTIGVLDADASEPGGEPRGVRVWSVRLEAVDGSG